ncbi:unnamed protein product [Linum trigynum]|uniref:Uncharacterized protein n=1 Tax=Linum trigynum TaxID=586398 RepID=A0AAV2G9D0_9ROSI
MAEAKAIMTGAPPSPSTQTSKSRTKGSGEISTRMAKRRDQRRGKGGTRVAGVRPSSTPLASISPDEDEAEPRMSEDSPEN